MSTTKPTPAASKPATALAIQALIDLLQHADPNIRASAAVAILDARRDGIA